MTAPLLVLSPFRGRLRPDRLAALERAGFAVHRVGRAAYVHDPELHAIFGAWAEGEPAPPWADRLGRLSAAWQRRYGRKRAEQSWRRLARDRRGRFAGRRPWYHWPAVQVYGWQSPDTVFSRSTP